MTSANALFRLLCTVIGMVTAIQAQAQVGDVSVDVMSEEDSVIAVYNSKKTDLAAMDFRFVYIDHEPPPATPATQLCTRLNKLRNNAAETGNALIVYLANEEEPFVSFTNLTDPVQTLKRDSVDRFYEIIDELQNIPSHEVSAITDTKYIKALISASGMFPLFDEINAVDTMLFKSVTIDFYVGPRFWNLRHHENIIAQIYLILRMSKYMNMYPRRRLSFNVYKAQGQELNYQEGRPFGLHNLDGINDNPKVNVIKEY